MGFNSYFSLEPKRSSGFAAVIGFLFFKIYDLWLQWQRSQWHISASPDYMVNIQEKTLNRLKDHLWRWHIFEVQNRQLNLQKHLRNARQTWVNKFNLIYIHMRNMMIMIYTIINTSFLNGINPKTHRTPAKVNLKNTGFIFVFATVCICICTLGVWWLLEFFPLVSFWKQARYSMIKPSSVLRYQQYSSCFILGMN